MTHSYGRVALVMISVLVGIAALLLLAGGLPEGGIVLGIAVLAPYAFYVALARPLAFPFGLYVVLVPFDNVLGTGSFGTITKLLGIVSGVFLLLWIARRGTLAAPANSMLPLVLLMAWMIVSTLWALDQGVALAIMPTYAGLIVLYIALCFTPVTMRDFHAVLFCVVVGGLLGAAYGANIFYHNPSLAAHYPVGRLVIQVGESSIDPNHFANSLLFPLIALAMWALRTPRLTAKLVGIGGAALILTAIMLSGSREALLATSVAVLYLLWRSRYRLQIAIASIASIAISSSVQTSMWYRFASVLDTGGSGRASIWSVAIEAAKHRPIEGYGIGNFQTAYDIFYLSVHQTYPYGFSSPAHNIIFHYVVELGVVGLVLLGWFFLRMFRSLSDVDTAELHDYNVMFEAALIAIVVVSLSVDLFTYKYAWLVFAVAALYRNAALNALQSEQIRRQSSAMMALRPLRS